MRKYICKSVVTLPIWCGQKEIGVTWYNTYITGYSNPLSLYINISGRHWSSKFLLTQNTASKNCCPCVICIIEPEGLFYIINVCLLKCTTLESCIIDWRTSLWREDVTLITMGSWLLMYWLAEWRNPLVNGDTIQGHRICSSWLKR